jgi:hypothetical protein
MTESYQTELKIFKETYTDKQNERIFIEFYKLINERTTRLVIIIDEQSNCSILFYKLSNNNIMILADYNNKINPKYNLSTEKIKILEEKGFKYNWSHYKKSFDLNVKNPALKISTFVIDILRMVYDLSKEQDLILKITDESNIESNINLSSECRLLHEQEILAKLKEMFAVSTRLRLDMIQRILNIDQNTIDRQIFKWAKQFNFKIDGDYIDLHDANVGDFIDQLTQQFANWEQNSKVKEKKL